MGERELLGHADPLAVAKYPDISETLVAVGAIFGSERNAVEACGNDAVVGDGVRNKQAHADSDDGRTFLFATGEHGVAIAESSI